MRKPPTQVVGVDLDKLRKVCREYIAQLESGDFLHVETEYVFEEALEALYGEEIWEWVNSCIV